MTGLRTKPANQNRLQLFTIRLRKRKYCSLLIHSEEPLRSGFRVTHTPEKCYNMQGPENIKKKNPRADSGRSPQVFLFPYLTLYGRLHRTPSCMHYIRLPFSCMHLRKSKRKSHQRENPKDDSCMHGAKGLF